MASFGLIDILGNTYSLSSVIVYGPDGKQKFPSGGGGSGTVTSVGFSAGTGISLSGTNPITTSGIITIINSAPDQTVVLTSGTGISVTGTYPSFTLTNTAPDQVVALTAGTSIGVTGTYPNFTISNLAPDVTVVLNAGTGISVSGTYPNFTITNTSPSSGGTVTSVGLTAGTGISIGGTSPITGSGSFSVTNTAPDQTVVLNNGTGISVTGTYPNFTIANSSPFTTPLTTKGDIYVRNGSADTRLPVGLNTQILLADSTAATGLKWGTNTAATPLGYYGAFQDVTNQTAAVINTGYPMLLGVTDLSNGVTVVSNSRITIANTGIYNIQWSGQFTNPTASEHDVTVWLRKNGVDVAGSSGVVLVPPKHGAADGHTLPSWNFLLDVVAGDYYEFVWSTANTSVYLSFAPAGSPPPSTASVVLTVTQQSGIMAGTGITAINSLTGAAQTLTTGTTGTDFAISSSGTTHTFNIPDASASARGLMTSAQWTTFTSKQAAITGAATTITSSDLTVSRALISNASGKVAVSATTDTELGYVSGVTSAIQTQITNLNSYVLSPFKSNTDIVHTGTLAETIVFSQLILAGTMAANDMIDYVVKYTPSATATAKTIKVYFNTSAALAGATLFATYGASVAATRYAGLQRKIIFKNSLASQQILLSTQPSAINEDTTTTVASELKTQNFAVNQYIIVSVQLTLITDTVTINGILSKTYR